MNSGVSFVISLNSEKKMETSSYDAHMNSSSPNSDTYIIFGEAKIEDLSSQLQSQAAEQFKSPNLSNVISKAEPSIVAQDDEDVDDTGVELKDADFVKTHAGVSRGKAVKALKATDGDIVSAIMELTDCPRRSPDLILSCRGSLYMSFGGIDPLLQIRQRSTTVYRMNIMFRLNFQPFYFSRTFSLNSNSFFIHLFLINPCLTSLSK